MTYTLEDILYLYYDRERKRTILVLANRQTMVMPVSLLQLLQQFCLANGSTMQGRITFFAYQQQIRQKVPLLICERKEIIFFPLYGKRCAQPLWIQYQVIKKIVNEEEVTTCLHFKNNTTLKVGVNHRSIRRQMSRCKTMIKFLQDL